MSKFLVIYDRGTENDQFLDWETFETKEQMIEFIQQRNYDYEFAGEFDTQFDAIPKKVVETYEIKEKRI
jgi:hypothetical protein